MTSACKILYLSPAVDLIISQGENVAEPAKRVADVELVLPFMRQQISMVDGQISSLPRGPTDFFAFIRIANFFAEMQHSGDRETYRGSLFLLWNTPVSSLPVTSEVLREDYQAFHKWALPDKSNVAHNDILDDQAVLKQKVESLEALLTILKSSQQGDVPAATDNESGWNGLSDHEDDNQDEDEEDETDEDDVASVPSALLGPVCLYGLDPAETKEGTTYDPTTGIVSANNADGAPLTYRVSPLSQQESIGVFSHNGKLRFVLRRVR